MSFYPNAQAVAGACNVNSKRQAPPDVEVRGMTKQFGSLIALREVSLVITPGTFHAILGENGAGKSTLVKCIMGYYKPDAGKIVVNAVPREISSPRAAHALGIGMVYQHFTLVPNMTVAENLILARQDVGALISWQKELERIQSFINEMPFKIDILAPASGLAAGEKQKVEILKQLFLDCRVLILDEPTSVLTPDEADQVLGLLRAMAEAKELSVVLITHKLREVTKFANEVTVLRHGQVVGRGSTQDVEPRRMAEWMVGAHHLPSPAARSTKKGGEPRLCVQDLRAEDDRGHVAVKGVSFDVCSGEIVGIAGVSGNGQRELVEVLAGQRLPVAGRVLVHGIPYTGSRREIKQHGVACLPEEPLRNACVARMTVAENLAFRVFDEPAISRFTWLIDYRKMREYAQKLIAQYQIRTASENAETETLSGGNLQRLVLARELSSEVQLLIAANPCFGLDIRAIAEIRGRIMQTRNNGAAVLLVSEDLDELFELADRLLVFLNGCIVAQAPIHAADRASIGHYMAGQTA